MTAPCNTELNAVDLTIPLIPPSANHYKIPTRRELADGRRIFTYTPETRAWFDAVAVFTRGRTVAGEEHAVYYRVYLGYRQRGDIDNFLKVLLDALVRARLLLTDNSVTEIHGWKDRDVKNPRTEITVSRIERPPDAQA